MKNGRINYIGKGSQDHVGKIHRDMAAHGLDQQLRSLHGIDIDFMHMGDSCVVGLFVRPLDVAPGPIPGA